MKDAKFFYPAFEIVKGFKMSQKNNNKNKQTNDVKKGWLQRFMARLVQANKKYPGAICRH